MAKTNLSYQINSAIEQAFQPGASKHSAKADGTSGEKVFSFNAKKSLQQVSFQFKDHMKKEFPDIRMMKDVKPEHWQSFLNEKSKTCGTATLENYTSRISKIEILCNKKYGFKSNWSSNILVPDSKKTFEGEKLRVQQMSPDHMQKIIKIGESSSSKAVPAINLGYSYALRVSEISNLKVGSVNLESMELKVIGKGGRVRFVELNKKDIPLLKNLSEGKAQNELLIGIKKDSINAYLNRSMEKLGIKNEYKETGMHSIRKLRAQEVYTAARNNGLSKKDSMDKVSKLLGHGENRYDTFNTYVQNQH